MRGSRDALRETLFRALSANPPFPYYDLAVVNIETKDENSAGYIGNLTELKSTTKNGKA